MFRLMPLSSLPMHQCRSSLYRLKLPSQIQDPFFQESHCQMRFSQEWDKYLIIPNRNQNFRTHLESVLVLRINLVKISQTASTKNLELLQSTLNSMRVFHQLHILEPPQEEEHI